MLGGFTIEPLAATHVDELEPLWNALREHHAALAPEWGEPRAREDSWAIKRPDFARWLDEEGGFCLVARATDNGTAVGCAVVKLNGPETIWPMERSGELDTLSVLPDWRSAGVGSALIAAARQQSEDAALMFEWFDRVGYDVDIAVLRRDFPEVRWHSFADWARAFDWSALERTASAAAS